MSEASETSAEGLRPAFLRKRTWLCRLAAFSFVAACTGAVLVAVLHHWPRVSALTYFFIVVPTFVWLGGLLPFLLAGFFGVRPRWVLAGAALWLGCLVATEELVPLVRPFGGRARARFRGLRASFERFIRRGKRPAGPFSVPLRVVTWNIEGGRQGATEAMAELAALKPDLVFLQEFGPGALKEAVQGNPYLSNFELVTQGRQALLSRFPVTNLPTGPLPTWRGGVWRVEVAPDLTVTCINVHMPRDVVNTGLVRSMELPYFRRAIRHTLTRLEDLRRTLELYRAEEAVVLAGDFNLPAHYPDLRRATAGFLDCFSEAGYGWGKTVPTRVPVLRIDLVYVPSGSDVYYAEAVPTRQSDHYMTLAEVAVPAAAGPARTRQARGPQGRGELRPGEALESAKR